MANEMKTIYVYAGWLGDDRNSPLIGRLYVDNTNGREKYSFEYDEEWLNSADSNIYLDPDLNFFGGRQYAPSKKALFGLFTDSCPDRWGRTLMKRREAIEAKREDRKPKKLFDSDFLLGVHDEARMGALRFKTSPDGEFLAKDKELATPSWATLRELEFSAHNYENDESGLETKWIKQLLAPGSSLGGARPKATVQDTKGNLWIAKFPSKHDEWNSGAWEKVTHDLAGLCQLNVPESKLETFSKNGDTFLVKRFDRDGKKRIHFASAMTLLGKQDGASGDEGDSYLELASFIKANGAHPNEDLVELWRRVVFNMAVSNTDDHLRNHGFILTEGGWRLSPLFDVNPIPYGENLSLNVNELDSSIAIELAIETAPYYGIRAKDAVEYASKITTIVNQNWESIAKSYGLSRNAIEYMRPAFAATNE